MTQHSVGNSGGLVDFSGLELANPMQTGDVLNDFDFDSYLPFDFNGTFSTMAGGDQVANLTQDPVGNVDKSIDSGMELANPLQTGNVLDSFDFDSFLREEEENQPFDFNGTFLTTTGVDQAGQE
ncbi:hypothetical protein B0T10DRAFT_499458 [Thelonectria olida]|uniref:Uncharacterized protein n=1 Tax=Thelonectria olida TaxID=1576542 RepID=A0A9P9AJC9_9HYPO|nr:hypothetical protein B0T10DRAFT_499458 [Thelonectria olida]